MRRLVSLLLLLSPLAQAAQVTLRQGETGRLGARQITVLGVQDRRCGPTEDCLADVVARVRVQQGAQTSLLTLRFPPDRLPRWSGVGVAGMTGGVSSRVTLTDQPSGSHQNAQRVTLGRGESGQLGPRQVKLLGVETRRCREGVFCTRPVLTSVYVQVRWGKNASWLALAYPPPPAWPGVSLIGATAGPRPALTLSDQPR
ncbi:hypothetical protein [Deinococcus budaensis]|uniref:Uncharacterized protein n=1 Tax=Deinococcus budaensis TaxID=1665626 RepID=A0A7W8GD24_9DEIO|nr:hypothetical protein [Deinococcus budaensis]MBB5233365.1 hypothetical protein [Deinococcus budaensis]